MTVRGAPFAESTQCTSRDCVLELDAVDYQGPDSSFKTRMYNGAIPGPTIRVQAGDTFHITVHNHLLDIDNFDFEELNIFKHPNSTGLHTHGLHVSPYSDNVFLNIPPSTSSVFSYTVPSSHQAGTYWYHPHLHGSTTLQAASALGMLIVEDADNEVPPRIQELVEVQIVLTHVNLAHLSPIQFLFNSALLKKSGEGDADEIMLVNGQSAPTLTVEAGKWYRWRILFQGSQGGFNFEFDNPSCEFQLLAKDGVYLQTAPRKVEYLPLYPAARCDVAVRCDGSVPTVNFVGGSIVPTETWNGTVINLDVVPSAVADDELPTFEVTQLSNIGVPHNH